MSAPTECPGKNQLSIKLIGIAGAGAHLIERLVMDELAAVSFALVHTTARLLERSPCDERVLMGAKRLRGLGAAGDPELARAVAEEECERLKTLCEGRDLILIA